ncbi:4a-hydroxytetrahydrobiopterin dehydratase [Vampirovibrio chlorellavorus]|uniref:4a-hydroxytetrahydrobiopterin dehydratase n=1 Tax=Vampirovibrio chlorellavorus TaxID=758823 RepID=UPI0026EA7827|nr:4a-hydroxytetrahydrobiopterin dehydratase [Vampirovibrio chlorellavorus]
MPGHPNTTQALSPAEIEAALQTLPHWQYHQNALQRVYVGANYLQALETLNAVARHAEAADHHPDLQLNWKTLVIRYWTHTLNGVSALDVALAHQVEALLSVPNADSGH